MADLWQCFSYFCIEELQIIPESMPQTLIETIQVVQRRYLRIDVDCIIYFTGV